MAFIAESPAMAGMYLASDSFCATEAKCPILHGDAPHSAKSTDMILIFPRHLGLIGLDRDHLLWRGWPGRVACSLLTDQRQPAVAGVKTPGHYRAGVSLFITRSFVAYLM